MNGAFWSTNCTLVIPFYASSTDRVINLRCVLAYYRRVLPDARVIVVEQDSSTALPPLLGVHHMRLPCRPGEFSIAPTWNAALRTVETEWVLLHEADILLPLSTLSTMLSTAADGPDAVWPYGLTCLLDRTATAAVWKTEGRCVEEATARGLANSPGVTLAQRGGLVLHATGGGARLLRTSAYWRVGGFDEDFVGWGYEDDAFLHKCEVLLSTVRIPEGVIVHLEHQSRNPFRVQDRLRADPAQAAHFDVKEHLRRLDRFRRNKAIFDKMRALDAAGLRAWIQE